jgi:hypothetical protein
MLVAGEIDHSKFLAAIDYGASPRKPCDRIPEHGDDIASYIVPQKQLVLSEVNRVV